MNLQIMFAVFKRDFRSYFVSLTGYVFVVAFVLLSLVAAFRIPGSREFFESNKANLDLLTEWFPLIVILFVPAITMTAWAREHDSGTGELLFTLPARDYELVLGKFFACLGVYTVALAFTFSNVLLLMYLGDPDMGLMATTYLGYWLLGAAAVAIGMLSSSLTRSQTLAWVLGAIFCVLLALPDWTGKLAALSTADREWARIWTELGPLKRFEAFGTGIIALEDILYFVLVTGGLLYANTFLVGRRHWQSVHWVVWTGGVILLVALPILVPPMWGLMYLLTKKDMSYLTSGAEAGGSKFPFLYLDYWTPNRMRIVHGAIRVQAIAIAICAAVLLFEKASVRADATEEQLLSLTPTTLEVLEDLNEKDEEGNYKVPHVYIQAWIAPEVPESYQATREDLVRMLRELDAEGGDRVRLKIYETELYSDESKEAEKAFGIKPDKEKIGDPDDKAFHMGLAFTCGMHQVKIPFMWRGLPIQYELTRSIGRLAQLYLKDERPKIGVFATQVDLLGGGVFSGSSEDWEFVKDLKVQYDVVRIDREKALDPKKLVALIVPMPSTLEQDKLDMIERFLLKGGRALFFCDPFYRADFRQSPGYNKDSRFRNPRERRPPPKRGDVKKLLKQVGVTWDTDRVVWDEYNPHLEWEGQLPHEFVFVVPSEEEQSSDDDEDDGEQAKATVVKAERSGFSRDEISDGFQEMVLLYPGELEAVSTAEVKVTPLLSTTLISGYHGWKEFFRSSGQQNPFRPPAPPQFIGERDLLKILNYDLRKKGTDDKDELKKPLPKLRILAAKSSGKLTSSRKHPKLKLDKDQVSKNEFKAVVIMDMDIITDDLYYLRQGRFPIDISPDNAYFVFNAIDWLTGEDRYTSLRKLRSRHRTLTRLEKLEREQAKKQREAIKEARKRAKKKREEAVKRVDEAKEKLKDKEFLDQKAINDLIAVLRREERRLEEEEREIEDDKKATIRQSKTDKKQAMEAEQDRVVFQWVPLIPLPVLLLGLLVLLRKTSVERAGIDPARRR